MTWRNPTYADIPSHYLRPIFDLPNGSLHVEELHKEAEETRTLSVIMSLDPVKEWLTRLQTSVKKVLPQLRDLTGRNDFHVTLAYTTLPAENTREAAEEARKVVKTTLRKPKVLVGPIGTFTNQKGEHVVALGGSSGQVDQAHWRLRRMLEDFGGEFTFPDFKFHVTLGYHDMPLTGEEKAQLKRLVTSRMAAPVKVDVTTKSGDRWKLKERVKIAAYAVCHQCGYHSVESSDEDTLRTQVDADGGVVDWGCPTFMAECPQCGTDLRMSI